MTVTIDGSLGITSPAPSVLQGSTSGSVTLTVPAVAGTNTLTLPAVTSTLTSAADFVSSLVAAGGYQKLPSGLIIQWGSASVNSTPKAVTWPIPFPTAFLVGFLQNTAQNGTTELISATTTGAQLYSSNATANTQYYIVLGY